MNCANCLSRGASILMAGAATLGAGACAPSVALELFDTATDYSIRDDRWEEFVLDDLVTQSNDSADTGLSYLVDVDALLNNAQSPRYDPRTGRTPLDFNVGIRRGSNEPFYTLPLVHCSTEASLYIRADVRDGRLERDAPIYLRRGERVAMVGVFRYGAEHTWWDDLPDLCTGDFADVCTLTLETSWSEDARENLRDLPTEQLVLGSVTQSHFQARVRITLKGEEAPAFVAQYVGPDDFGGDRDELCAQ